MNSTDKAVNHWKGDKMDKIDAIHTNIKNLLQVISVADDSNSTSRSKSINDLLGPLNELDKLLENNQDENILDYLLYGTIDFNDFMTKNYGIFQQQPGERIQVTSPYEDSALQLPLKGAVIDIFKCSHLNFRLRNNETNQVFNAIALLLDIFLSPLDTPRYLKRVQTLTQIGLLDLLVIEMQRFYDTDINEDVTKLLSNTLWNLTDIMEFNSLLSDSPIINLIVLILERYQQKESNEGDDDDVVEAMVTCVSNLARWDEGRLCLHKYPQVLLVCEKLLKHENKIIASVASFAICFISGRDEQGFGKDIIERCPNIISDAIKILDEICTAPEESDYHPQEPSRIFLNLSISDANKPSLVPAIPIMLAALSKFPNNQQMVEDIIETLFQLSFDETIRKDLTSKLPKYTKAIEKCKLSESAQKHNNFVLSRLQEEKKVLETKWVADVKERRVSASSRASASGFISSSLLSSNSSNQRQDDQMQHIMISYNWKHKDTVKIIHSHLVKRGYKVWIDMEQMSGNVADRMAEAVENSAAVLICVSSKYKESANCRQEAEYALECKKPMIILMMEKDYKANGWLGLLIGRRLWKNCTSKFHIDVQGILNELDIIGITPNGKNSVDKPKSGKHNNRGSMDIVSSHDMTDSTSNSASVGNKMEKMTASQCKEWIESADLSPGIKAGLLSLKIDGKALLGMYMLLTTSPGSIAEIRIGIGCENIAVFSSFFVELERLVHLE